MRIEYTNGYYEGEVNYNKEHHGKGKFIYKSGDKYIGEIAIIKCGVKGHIILIVEQYMKVNG